MCTCTKYHCCFRPVVWKPTRFLKHIDTEPYQQVLSLAKARISRRSYRAVSGHDDNSSKIFMTSMNVQPLPVLLYLLYLCICLCVCVDCNPLPSYSLSKRECKQARVWKERESLKRKRECLKRKRERILLSYSQWERKSGEPCRPVLLGALEWNDFRRLYFVMHFAWFIACRKKEEHHVPTVYRLNF